MTTVDQQQATRQRQSVSHEQIMELLETVRETQERMQDDVNSIKDDVHQIKARLAEGDRLFHEQDAAILLQGKALRTIGQIKALHTELGSQLDEVDRAALQRSRTPRPFPSELPTNPVNEKPTQDGDTIPAGPNSSGGQ